MSLAEFDEVRFTHSTTRLDAPSPYLLKKARRKPSGLTDIRNSYNSGTIYVGNLSFYTTEEQIYELFSKIGLIKQIIMGLDRFNYTPCGFCFVIFYNNQDSINAVKFLNGTKLDDRSIQIDLDPGFKDGRQFGRGVYGGQVRDELRFEYDSARGGYGKQMQEQAQEQEQGQFNQDLTPIDGNVMRFGARRVERPEHDTYIPGQDIEETPIVVANVIDENQETDVPVDA